LSSAIGCLKQPPVPFGTEYAPKPIAKPVFGTKSRRRKMKMKPFSKELNVRLPITMLILMLLFCVESSFAIVCGIDATTGSQDLIEDILGTPVATGFLASAGVPLPNGEDGNARSSTHYYYCTNGGPDDRIFEIDLAGNLTNVTGFPNANFQGLAYVNDALGPGQDRLYGLDIILPGLIEFDPALPGIPPTGVIFPVPDADRGCAGGDGRLFVQIRPGPNRIVEIDPNIGAPIGSFPTPMGGAVLFDGLAFDGTTLFGSEVVFPNSNIWKMNPNTGGVIGAPVNLPYWFAALGAISSVSPIGSIKGNVIDGLTGGPIPRAIVIAINRDTKEKAFGVTDSDGYYEIPGLEQGNYLVLCIKRGYQIGFTGAFVMSGEATIVNFTLEPKPK
jgi:outer membrane protein assembly factor BamB